MARAGTNPEVQRAISAPMISREHDGAGPGDERTARAPIRSSAREDVSSVERDLFEERIFGLVFRQMNALWGRYRPDFDDLVQIAAEQALKALPSFRKEAELSTWTYRICYRAVLRHQRWSRRWLRRFTLEPLAREPAAPELDGCSELERRERSQRLARALGHLSDKRRSVVVLRDLEGLDIHAIAEIVGTNEATVRSRLRDGRRTLALLLRTDPYFGNDACAEELP